MITRYHTRSGSMYDFRISPAGEFEVRQMYAGGSYGKDKGGQRFKGQVWLPAASVDGQVGYPLSICWGTGRDEYSPSEEDDGIRDEDRFRTTVTSRITLIEILEGDDA